MCRRSLPQHRLGACIDSRRRSGDSIVACTLPPEARNWCSRKAKTGSPDGNLAWLPASRTAFSAASHCSEAQQSCVRKRRYAIGKGYRRAPDQAAILRGQPESLLRPGGERMCNDCGAICRRRRHLDGGAKRLAGGRYGNLRHALQGLVDDVVAGRRAPRTGGFRPRRFARAGWRGRRRSRSSPKCRRIAGSGARRAGAARRSSIATSAPWRPR